MSKNYMPSNGTEGDIFISKYCSNCRKEKYYHTQKDGDRKCRIFTSTMIESSVPEWIIEDGNPTCTSFDHWDWDKGNPPGIPRGSRKLKGQISMFNKLS